MQNQFEQKVNEICQTYDLTPAVAEKECPVCGGIEKYYYQNHELKLISCQSCKYIKEV